MGDCCYWMWCCVVLICLVFLVHSMMQKYIGGYWSMVLCCAMMYHIMLSPVPSDLSKVHRCTKIKTWSKHHIICHYIGLNWSLPGSQTLCSLSTWYSISRGATFVVFPISIWFLLSSSFFILFLLFFPSPLILPTLFFILHCVVPLLILTLNSTNNVHGLCAMDNQNSSLTIFKSKLWN